MTLARVTFGSWLIAAPGCNLDKRHGPPIDQRRENRLIRPSIGQSMPHLIERLAPGTA
jgi:hypothetical protein